MKLLRIFALVAALVASGFAAYSHTGVSRADSAVPSDEITSNTPLTDGGDSSAIKPHDNTNGQAHARFGINGIDSLPNFNLHYFVGGYDSNGNANDHWYTNTLGNPPQLGGTTYINAPIIPVKVYLDNADGSPRYINGHQLVLDPTPYIQNVLNSPVFSNSTYSSSSTPTQITDAIQRAEFAKTAKPDWHTILVPQVKATREIHLLKGQYQFSYNSTTNTVRYVLANYFVFGNDLFPATGTDTTTPIGAAEHAGDMTTKDYTTMLFPNTYLFIPTQTGSLCCVLGYHTYDVENGDPSNGNRERDYVVNYSNWTTPGLFRGGADAPQDITSLSHEVAESFNDPFVTSNNVNNVTPWWKSSFNCQNNLEVGDVIEGLPNDNYPVTMSNGITYHPQNEALMQWFGSGSKDMPAALDGAYSYPNESVLPTPNVSQKANCAP